ncbi:hypothetical protein O3M35_006120 [Rhynocoris fuscipes]|uniref:Uncharacterized protein n=1 Tax=Rhynocoris fuscipes TaxID=488301 RepID=A0AAW1DDT7_9HEMI
MDQNIHRKRPSNFQIRRRDGPGTPNWRKMILKKAIKFIHMSKVEKILALAEVPYDTTDNPMLTLVKVAVEYILKNASRHALISRQNLKNIT